jgi:hypothetical protein
MRHGMRKTVDGKNVSLAGFILARSCISLDHN